MFGKKQEKPIIIESTIVETREERLHREQADFVAWQERETAQWNMKQHDIYLENKAKSERTSEERWKKICEKWNL